VFKQRVGYFAVFLVLAALMGVAGCATSTNTGFASAQAEGSGPAVAGDAVSIPASGGILTVASAGTNGSVADIGDYRIASKDVLEVTVFRVPDLSATVTVNPAGYIQLPLSGQIQAGGKTVGELRAIIVARLKEYLQAPDVRIVVKDAASQRVTLEGAVNKPGVYPTDSGTTLMQVIATAGGLKREADTRGIVVFRNVEGKRQAAKFDYGAITSGRADDPAIVSGDVIVVDESGVKAALRVVRESMGIFGLFSPFL
jgi:polysaccharide biosynthesis/export protein